MTRQLVTGLLIAAALALPASLALAAVPSPANSSVAWAGPFNGTCTFPVICPRGGAAPDANATINVTVRDQFNAAMAGIAANEIVATGSCLLGGGSPCGQVLSIAAQGPTSALGATTIVIGPGTVGGRTGAGGCCADLQVSARGVTLNTLSYRSYDYTADLSVSLADLSFMANTYNKGPGDVGYNECFNFDCNLDGAGKGVTLADLSFFASHYNHQCL